MKRFFQIGLGLAAMTTAVMTALSLPVNAQLPPAFDALDLTEDQEAQVEAIFDDFKTDIEDILTDEQRSQFRTTLEETQNVRTAIAEMDDLTDEQKLQAWEARQSVREELQSVLTEEQLSELRSLRQEGRRNRR
ncbi:MAG: Spy/CpxP family protein refolding chaperone [Leptolyngbyaceae cyanobacterium]